MNSDISLVHRLMSFQLSEVDDLDEDSKGQQGAEDDDDFLDDNTSATHSGGVHLHPVATGDEETEDVDQYVKELTEHVRKRRHIEHTEGNHDEDSHNTNKTSYKTSLWHVWCKRSSQEHLVNVLTCRQHVCGKTISHIFALPRIRNWVYLVVQSLHTSIYTLLVSCSSIITSGGRAIFQEVPLDEQADTLKMLQSKSLEEGDWIVVKMGPYHGDMGCIRGIFEWGLDVLVVPRFVDLEFIHVSKKTQRHTKHNLLGPGGNPYVLGMNTHCLAITKLCFNEKACVDKGLLVLECRHNNIPPNSGSTKAPCPCEWLFEEEEEVEVLSQSGDHDRRQGKIVVVASHHVEVLLDASKGLHRFPFYQVVKLFCVGDYVRGINGLKEGFIQSCSDFHVVLLTMGDNGDFEDFSCGKNTVHKLNRVQNENSNAADNDTWTGIRVIVRKCNHHLDGCRATMTSMAQTMFRLRAVVTLHKNSITNYTLDPDHLVDER
ncbi:hypothetical protein IW261DRAFT_1578012 [Armillaria novae-zelandiae]|uniref:Uncharacterized protein n=1 Tax=Armillaria novae-zelandiae TaxID=153914 RepID=A0AA39KGC8_9AGAR|nr:hypothetical protein IW261DRAFT_1578012 [Armillaria novae-zelandiae]